MGSLTSRPKVSSASAAKTVYVPVTQYAPAPIVTTPTTTPTTTTTTGSNDTGGTATAPVTTTAQDVRSSGLLQRSRGALSTVLTSFRGVLDDNAGQSPRKTLLGE